jgi:hypothetical protein
MKSAMRSGVIVVEQVERKRGVAMTAGAIAAGVGPFAREGLDEAFGLAIGLWPIRPGEAVRDAEVAARVGKNMGAIRHAIVVEDRSNLDAMEGVKADHLLEGVNNAGDLFIGVDAGEAERSGRGHVLPFTLSSLRSTGRETLYGLEAPRACGDNQTSPLRGASLLCVVALRVSLIHARKQKPPGGRHTGGSLVRGHSLACFRSRGATARPVRDTPPFSRPWCRCGPSSKGGRGQVLLFTLP